jgi:ABC-type multidrug transport system ATPase subunit
LIWKNIKKSVKSGQTIFLTTLSLEECEMLCSNILFFTKNEHKEYTMSEFKRKFASIVILQLSFKKGIIDGSKTDAELCKLYFDSQKGEYEYLKNFEFTDRRNVRKF